MYYAYVLKSKKNGKHYIGHTENIERRLYEHNAVTDKCKFTYISGPWDLMFFENFSTRSDAMKHERFLKSGKGREYIKNKIAAIKNDMQSGRGSVW
ncbi:MAG: GIY-YIG nuclease family protein [Candidatus Omnitrophota bacterium]